MRGKRKIWKCYSNLHKPGVSMPRDCCWWKFDVNVAFTSLKSSLICLTSLHSALMRLTTWSDVEDSYDPALSSTVNCGSTDSANRTSSTTVVVVAILPLTTMQLYGVSYVSRSAGFVCSCAEYMSLKTSMPSLRQFIAISCTAFDNTCHLVLRFIKN